MSYEKVYYHVILPLLLQTALCVHFIDCIYSIIIISINMLMSILGNLVAFSQSSLYVILET